MAKSDAKARLKQEKADSDYKKASGTPLFTPLPISDQVIVFDKEGK